MLKEEIKLNFPVLKCVEDRLREILENTRGFVQEVITYLFENPGKLLRPMLVIFVASLHPRNLAATVEVAVAVELIHMASLVHDDIIDGSPSRRGKATLNQRWGGRVAVLTGDYLFATALGLLTKFREAMEIMCFTIQEMCRGEIAQDFLAYSLEQTETDYLQQIQAKTASLFAASCRASAVVNNYSEKEIEALMNYGLNIGNAFQIVDDILDLTGDPGIVGKPVGSDLANGIFTLPVLHLLRCQVHRPWFEKMVIKREFNSENLARLRELAYATGSIDYAYQRARSYQRAAKECLADIPGSPGKKALLFLADYVLERNF